MDSVMEKTEQLVSDIRDHAEHLMEVADIIETSYSDEDFWYRIIDSLETLRNKWLTKTISDAKELKKMAEEKQEAEIKI